MRPSIWPEGLVHDPGFARVAALLHRAIPDETRRAVREDLVQRHGLVAFTGQIEVEETLPGCLRCRRHAAHRQTVRHIALVGRRGAVGTISRARLAQFHGGMTSAHVVQLNLSLAQLVLAAAALVVTERCQDGHVRRHTERSTGHAADGKDARRARPEVGILDLGQHPFTPDRCARRSAGDRYDDRADRTRGRSALADPGREPVLEILSLGRR